MSITDEVLTDIVRILGLPKNVRQFTLQARPSEVTCTYTAEELSEGKKREVIRRFELHPEANEEPYFSQPVPFR